MGAYKLQTTEVRRTEEHDDNDLSQDDQQLLKNVNDKAPCSAIDLAETSKQEMTNIASAGTY